MRAMDVRVDGDCLAEWSVDRLQLGIARLRQGSAPRAFRTGVDESHRAMNLALRQTAQPVKSLLTNGFAGCGRHLGDHREQRL